MDTHPQSPEQLSQVKRAIVEIRRLRSKLKDVEATRNGPIAVIGMGCRLPGNANDPASLWRMLCNGTDAIREVPPERWDIDEFFDPDPDAPGKMSTRWGGFLDAVDQFDASFFGVSPREAVSLDPQQRLFLEVSWEALENAGQSPEALLGSPTGVFVGIASNDYAQLQMQFGDPAEIDHYFATGTCHSVTAGRVSYTLGLQGPALAVDTACSSSLVAVHLACQSLRLGECRMALAGGVNVILAPELLIDFSRSHMMAADGRCKAFDAAADGFVRAEGCGVVVLKRLADAVAEGDHILAIIRGAAINQDGRSSGLTVPNGASQQEVIRKALANAGVDPADVGYVETHGTGTSLGDPIEVHALSAVYGEGRSKETPLAIGAIKTNMGHLETAAGVAGLMKAVLVLMHGEIPPSLHFRNPNPHIGWEHLPITVPTTRTAWPVSFPRRIAGVSSFGFSGTNAHLVLESADAIGELLSPDSSTAGVATSSHPESYSFKDRSDHVFTLSARTADALKELTQRHIEHFVSNPQLLIGDVCHTANTGRSHFEHRLAVTARSPEQLREKLAAWSVGEDAVGALSGHADLTRRPDVVFLFTGQGGQYLNMGRTLYESEPVFRDVVDHCDELTRPYLEKPLHAVMFGAPGEATPLDETAYTHVAMFAVQYGLAQLWRSWGVEPAAVMGHSVGEIVAATVAGGMSMEDGLMIMRERGRLMQSLPSSGLMASLLLGEAETARAIDAFRERVAIAAVNGPESTVISGERGAVEAILDRLAAQGVKTKRLKVSTSFHSPLVEPVLDEFERSAQQARYRTPEVAQFSSMRQAWVDAEHLLDAGYWRHNLRHTVHFSDALRALYEQGYRVFVEIGPTPTLVGMGAQCVPGGEAVWLPSLRQDRGEWEQMLEVLSTLYVHGAPIDWQQFDRQRSYRKVMLPTCPWQRKQFLVEAARTRQQGFDTGENSRWHDLVTSACVQSRQVPMDLKLDSYPAKWEALDALTTGHIAQTLSTLGAFRRPAEGYSLDSLLEQFRILPLYRTLVSHWLEKLAAEGILHKVEDAYSSPSPVTGELQHRAGRVVGTDLTDIPFVIEYMSRCGQMAAAIVTGQGSPLETLFPDGSVTMAENIYEHWALSRYFNGIVRSAVESLVRTLPHGHQLRIAEVGAGTGSVASSIVPTLPDGRALYCFTDLSKFFLERASQKFEKYPFLRFGLLDIEKDPSPQGFGQHAFDVVIASNVLHATRDLDETVNNVLKLLSPGGVLILCEVTRAPSWIEFSYGLMDGWHRSEEDQRQDTPLLSQGAWETLLRGHGFEDVVAYPEPGSAAEVLGQHCIIARAPSSACPRRYDAPAVIQDVSSPATDGHEIQTPAGRGENFVQTLRQLVPSEQWEQLLEFVRLRTMKVLRRDRSDPVESRRPLMDLGLDSLMAVELRTLLSTDLGLQQKLPATLMFDYPTVEAIAGYLATRVLNLYDVPSESNTGNSRPSIPRDGAKRASEVALDHLSDIEVEKLLLEKLATI